MQFSMTSDYAIRTAIFLASQQDNVCRIVEIARNSDVPESYLRKIVPMLAKAGLVQTTSGVTGGIRLARDPFEITLFDILEVTEGDLFLNRCLIGPTICHRSVYCPVHNVWADLQAQMRELLSSKTIADLAAQNAERYKEFISQVG